MTLPAIVGIQDCLPLRLPDIRQLEQMPSWPAWVASRIASLQIAPSRDRMTGQLLVVTTLPERLIFSPLERKLLECHEAELKPICECVPARDADAEKNVFGIVTKMMLVFPAPTQNELSAEARGEAYMAALQDLPSWAVTSAFRLWCRGKCGLNSRSEPFDYRWCPAPAELREIAHAEFCKVKGRLDQVRYLLSATTRIEYGDDHCRTMRGRLADLFRKTSNSPVGETAAAERSVNRPTGGAYCGTQPKHNPA